MPDLSVLSLVQLTTALVALISAGIALVQPARSPLTTTWALFCASMVFFMVHNLTGDELGAFAVLVAAGGSATCGWFWLFSRALFRTHAAVDVRHYAVAGLIVAPAVLDHVVVSESWAPVVRMGWTLASMLSSTILVLAFWEAVRGWKDLPSAAERRFRMGFAGAYVLMVTVSVVWVGRAVEGSFAAQMADTVKALCAFAAVGVAGFAVWYRRAHPLASEMSSVRPRARSAVNADEAALAQAIERHMRDHRSYMIPSLKVSDLADRLGVPDYKVSRAVTGALGCRNFNQFINRYRVAHAKRLLADPACADQSILAIGLDSGFGSIGPFNRAFKESEGLTPREFRSRARQEDPEQDSYALEGASGSVR